MGVGTLNVKRGPSLGTVSYSPSQKEQWRAQVMGEWLVGVTLHLFDKVVTHRVPLEDHWKGEDWGISDCTGGSR